MIHTSKVVWLAALPALVALPVAAAPQGTQTSLKFPTPSGRVVYRMTGSGPMAMNSTITMTWANSGQKFRQDMQMHMNMGGTRGARKGTAPMKPMTMNTWTIYDGQYVYSATPGARKVMRMKVPKTALNQMIGMGAMGGMGAGGMGGNGKIVGHATVLGKPAMIRTTAVNTPRMGMNAKLWMWGNLPLRMEMTMKFKPMAMPTRGTAGKNPPRSFQPRPVKMTMVATSLDANAKPSPSLFRVPAGYTVQDMGDFRKQMQQMRAQRRMKQQSSTH